MMKGKVRLPMLCFLIRKVVLSLLNSQSTDGELPIYITLSPKEYFVLTANYKEHQKRMEKDVLISIRGLQYLMDEESGEQEPVEVMTTGSYYKKNGHHFLIYDEATEGFDMMTHNMIKFTENALEVRKRGLIDVHMIFEEDKKNISFYHTPYGMINMGVAATKVRMKETPDQILLKAEYALDINDSYVGDCVIDIEVRPREGGKLNL